MAFCCLVLDIYGKKTKIPSEVSEHKACFIPAFSGKLNTGVKLYHAAIWIGC